MNTTQVKWNNGYPTKEQAEGKLLLTEWNPSRNPELLDLMNGISYSDIEWSKCYRWSILSDEQAVCEYDNEKNTTSCGWNENTAMTYCPNCGLPIHIVDELKPLPLMGIEVFAHSGMADDWFCVEWRNTEIFNSVKHIMNEYRVIRPTEREAIESWNSLVKKLAGEK